MSAQLTIARLALTGCLLNMPGAAMACSVCFGDPESPQTAAMNFAIWTMLGVTGFVFAGLGALVAAIVLRGRRAGEAATAVAITWENSHG